MDQLSINLDQTALLWLLAGSVLGVVLSSLLARNLYLKYVVQSDHQRASLEHEVETGHTEQERLRQSMAELKQQVDSSDILLTQRGEELVALKSDLLHQRQHADEKIHLLNDAKKQLTQEFELLANRIFDEKNERFTKNSKTTLDGAINPLREQISEFKKKVEDVYDKDSKERVSLVAELGHLKELNLKISDEANNLAKALKGDNKTQGNWGEVILERVLEDSGLHKGREYDTQVNLKSSGGGRRSPDVIVRLPENKDIVIDAKVSLLDYERYCNLEDEEQRQQALKAHIASVRGHINNLSFKDYENLEGIRTLDFVFIFIPIEAAFMIAFEHDQSMYKDAYEKNIIVVGPTTLLATLRTVQSIWRYERQNKNAEEIARQAGAMHDKFVRFIDDLDDIGNHLQRAEKAHNEAYRKLSSGPGNLIKSTQKLEKLGAKVKRQLPAAIADASDETDLRIVDDNESS